MSLPGNAVDAAGLALDHSPLPDELVVEGAPTTGHREVTSLSDVSIGIWEHTPGVSRDVESDEVFVVLSGDATVAFDDGSPAIDLRPGSLVRLYAGQHTTWTVRETLRKVFVA
ncbi:MULTISPECIES: cupin domain-containing protein [unclassified Mycolicibacterium]|uniref:cupin domain-containing protein n=1 Tax=unclassified Mycolicibacterium TaxID=2636767 RepID=UPI0012DD8A9D|nr:MULTISPECIES: cupin domain-containing protein [unclassified Mycolicibacterium]MUL81437.1 cupin domain-containing protein [Mycolicibacterium sp. CBMA 329]MUL87203.1 cupin domain-containing protein [Mycolicibacterium sp. CBMA 331]MUL98515.1 cupin domain-containing protein [Mycolicibacterium sp. CBMA 334]MUM25269.1 cupin domain-containing protein [Mycolicibacterium sp. CBMA 295]MUM37500.1 cupin domain-containing protein [Mycolicibacterium sp. CBMA 247]